MPGSLSSKKDLEHHQKNDSDRPQNLSHHRESRRGSLLSNMSRSVLGRKGSIGSITSIVAKSSSGVYYLKPLKKKRTKKQIESLKKDVDIEEHGLDFEELQLRYDTNLENGLSKAKADDLLIQNGPNCLVPPKQKSKWLILLKFLFGGFSALIWTGSALSFIEYGITYLHEGSSHMDTVYLGIVLAVEATLTGFFAFYVQQTHSRIMDSFRKMIPKYATVIRDGEKYTIPSEELVLGDLVEINMGDMVPADLRILESHSLKVDNSALTGETNPVSRGPEFSHHDPLETMNLAFYGTNVVEGSGLGLVIRCGDDTVLGHIAGLASSIQKDETLLRKELNFFVKIISIVAFMIGLTLFSLSMATGYSFFKSFTFFIAIVVANVPEGLPVAFTVCMTLTAKRMAKKNCLIKKFEILETLGACDIICSDKTGTLTQKVMTASHIYFDGSEYDVLHFKDEVNTESEAYAALCDVAILCSRAVFAQSEETMTGDPTKPDQASVRKKVHGDASEAAILRLMDELYEDIEQRRSECPKVCEIPFTSSNKYQVSIHRLPSDEFLLVMKGAPEKILEHCSVIFRDGQILHNNQANTKPIRRALINLGNRGERVLGFADLYLNPKQFPPDYKFDAEKMNFSLDGLRFVGLISLIDPPRPEVPLAVAKCKSAGIQVIMITGDHPVTAMAIAKKVGIILPSFGDEHGFGSPKRHSSSLAGIKKDTSSIYKMRKESSVGKSKLGDYPAAIITGGELKDLTNDQLVEILKNHKEVVFARTNPQQKLQIVEALQGLEKVVAVTGDGVNDSPALKQADIGIAMGIAGSDVSKEAADMILLDDNFATIVIGIEEGRLIFDNLKKSIAYELTANIPEIAPFVFLALLRIPRALSIMSILVINVGTDLWGAISLAYEKPEADIMARVPRDPKKDKLINRRLIGTSYFQIGIIQTISAFICYFYLLAGYGWHWDKLLGIREKWESKEVNDLEDSYGQEWTYEMREVLTRKCISVYFLSIVCTQIGDLLRCKTRRLSIISQGMTNHVLNTGLFFEISLALFFVFCPGLNKAFDFEPVNVLAVAPAVPFAVLIVLYDEFRKYMIRKYPKKWFYNNTYY